MTARTGRLHKLYVDADGDIATGSAGNGCEVGPPTCADYCASYTASCGGMDYADAAACEAYCGAGASLPVGAAGDTSGNTIGCRLYHADMAATDATTHCPHAGKSGANTCGTWCDNYCHLALTNCTGASELYADLAACETACGGFVTTGAPGDTAGNTVQCRIHYLGMAVGDEPAQCENGSASSTLCVD